MRSPLLLFAVLILAVCLTQFASDIYAPSIPNIALVLQCSLHWAQWSMVVFMFGVSGSELIYGPLSEGIGRKAPLIIGLIIMLVGSVICMFAHQVDTLIIGRFIQGCGAGACACLWRSVFRDVFTGEELATYSSYFAIFITLIIPLAPIFGGYLETYFNWRASFIFMCCYTLIALFAILIGYQETNTTYHREKLKLAYIKENYFSLLRHRVFMGASLCNFLGYGLFFAWVTVAPALLIHKIGLSPVKFGWFICLGSGAGYVISNWLNGRCVKRFGMSKMIRLGFVLIVCSGFWLLSTTMTFWSIALPILLFYFAVGFISPNVFAIAFTPVGNRAGYAAALYGFLQISGGAVVGSLAAHLSFDSQKPFAGVLIIISSLSWLIYEYTARASRCEV